MLTFLFSQKTKPGFSTVFWVGWNKNYAHNKPEPGLDVLSFVSTPREKPGYGRFPPGSIALGWVQEGAWTHKNTKNIPIPFNGVPSWLCFGLGTATSQLVARVLVSPLGNKGLERPRLPSWWYFPDQPFLKPCGFLLQSGVTLGLLFVVVSGLLFLILLD